MWQFVCGFVSGVYVGSYYNCKPIMNRIKIFIVENLPKDKSKGKNTGRSDLPKAD